MTRNVITPSDIFFSPSVKTVQARLGSREGYARMAERGAFQTEITPGLAAYLGGRNSVYLATASADGQPYIQHRGGPPGFLKVLDTQTFGWADYRGNRQYVSIGNLAENGRACLFAMDYEAQQRVKIWGRARVVEDNPDLIASLMPAGYQTRAELAVLFTVEVWDANCPQHIPPKVNASEVEPIVRHLKSRVAELERELATLRGGG